MVQEYGQKVSSGGTSRSEKVLTRDGGDGLWHYIERQNLSNSCGPACATMAVMMIKGLRISAEYLAGLVAVAEMGQYPQSVSPLSGVAQQAHDFEARGTTGDALLLALQDARVSNAREAGRNTTDWAAEWANCSQKAPAIAGFRWGVGGRYAYAMQGNVDRGGHYVVVAGPFKNDPNKILILDPAYGVQQLNIKKPTTYTPRQGGGDRGQVLATGTLSISTNAPTDQDKGWTEVILTY